MPHQLTVTLGLLSTKAIFWEINTQKTGRDSKQVWCSHGGSIHKKVIFRFGFPHSLITDNGTNLSKGEMEDFCQREHIRLDVSSVAHPQSNGQAERDN